MQISTKFLQRCAMLSGSNYLPSLHCDIYCFSASISHVLSKSVQSLSTGVMLHRLCWPAAKLGVSAISASFLGDLLRRPVWGTSA
eukprot:c8353_g1_i2 orf=89-343(+)